MDGKLFLYNNATPPPMSQVAAATFSFDLQRFADSADSLAADKNSESSAISQGYYIFAKKNASDTGGYFKSIKDASEKYIASNAASDNTVMGEIKLLADVNDAKGFQTKGEARITIDLNNHNLIFTEDLKADGVQVGKGKVMQILKEKSSNEDNVTYVEIKNGTIGVAGTTTDTFERLIRSYADLKLTNVTLDGTNVKDQTKNADDALLCISAGDVTLDGTTNIITKGDGYYAIGGKLTDSLASPATTSMAYNYGPGFSINISVNGDIPSVVLNEFMQETFSATSTSTFDRAHISIASGNIGRIALSELARSLGGAAQISISGGTFGTFDYDTTASSQNKFLIYGGTGEKDSFNSSTKEFVTTFDGWKFGAKGWNAASPSETNTEYNYVTAESSGTTTPGTMILNAKNVEDKSALVLDDDRKTFGVPTGATANLLQSNSDYKFAYLNYNSDKDAVTVSGATEGAVLAAKASSVASANDGILAFDIKTINASNVNVGASIFANSINNEIYGGTGANVVSLGSGNDTYVYGGGADTIDDYESTRTGDKDIIRLSTNFDPVTNGESIVANGNDLVLNFGGTDSLNFKGIVDTGNSVGSNSGLGVTLLSSDGKDAYIYRKGSVGLNASDSKKNGVTLTSGYSGSTYTPTNAYYTINGAAVANAISITGDNYNNYIIGGKKGGTLFGDSGDDTLVRGASLTTFQYAEGNDVVEGYTTADKVAIDSAKLDDISSAKVSRKGLAFTFDKNNSLTFSPVDDKTTEKVSLNSDGYLTQAGYVNGNSNAKFKLFAGTKGTVDINGDSIYGGGKNISTIDASAVKNSVTLVGASVDGALNLASNNKKDLFEYNGGAVSITGYEAGKDRINVEKIGPIYAFGIDNDNDVAISVSGTGADVISLQGAKGQEVLIHDADSKGNSYQKFVFHANGVLYNKAKKPTEANIYSNVDKENPFTAEDSVKKIFLQSGVANVSIKSGENKSTLDASAAGFKANSNTTGVGVSLVGGTKNNKFIGTDYADTFYYYGGKDNIANFSVAEGTTDSIVLSDTSKFNINEAKITLSKKSLKFKFDSKNTLALKSDSAIDSLSIGGQNYAFAKNSIAKAGQVSLTSAFSGTYKIKDGVNYVDGHLVEKNLTYKGTSEAETLIGGEKKTTFKAGGAATTGTADSLVGGTGKDIFFYAKGDKGESKIANFEFGTDKLKIANGTISKISTVTGGIQFDMTSGKKNDTNAIGYFFVENTNTNNADSKPIAIKANSTYYWFANGDEVLASSAEGETLTANQGDLITLSRKVSARDVSDYAVIDLGYSTNLTKSAYNVAFKVKGDVPTPSQQSSG